MTSDVPVEILQRTAFFRDLDADRLARVAALAELRRCVAGEAVYRVGEPARALYVLIDGTVRLGVAYGGRDASAGDLLRRGDVFGWAALTPTCNLRIANASCVRPCGLLAIDGARLLQEMEADHTLGYRLMTQLTGLVTGTLTAFAGG